MASGAPNRLASAPEWKPDIPDTPHSIAWKLNTLPLIRLSTPDCIIVSPAVSYSVVDAPAKPNSTSDSGSDLESEKQSRKQPNPNIPPTMSQPLCRTFPTEDSVNAVTAAPALAAANSNPSPVAPPPSTSRTTTGSIGSADQPNSSVTRITPRIVRTSGWRSE